MSDRDQFLRDNRLWLAGYDAFRNSDGCPWDPSARLGWIAARNETQENAR